MNTPVEAAPAAASSSGPSAREFSVLRQKLNFDVDLLQQSVQGETEIVVAPHTSTLRQIRLHCRQCDILSVTVEDRPARVQYVDPYRSLTPNTGWGVKQHHMYKERLEAYIGDNAREELVIEVPRKVVVRESSSIAAIAADGGFARPKVPVPLTPGGVPDTPIGGAAELQTDYQTLSVKISFALKDARDGIHFVGLTPGDNRYPVFYTRNSHFTGSACCLFPCLDDPTERLEWEVSVKCAKNLGSALGLKNADPAAASEGLDELDADPEDDVGLSEQERVMDLTVICSGQFEDESDDPFDATRKIVTFSTRDIYCSANQIGFAIGPFEQVDISDLREVDEDDKLAEDAVQVLAYCLPGRSAEVRNTVLPMAKAIDFFTERYTKYFYPSYHMCFLDDLSQDFVATTGLSFLSTRLLFPQEIIDPIYDITHTVVHALATQYAGIGLTAREPADSWCIIGMAHFMADMFMKSLCGNNEYRFRQKLAVERIVELDRERPSLHSLGSLLQLDASELEFLALKAAAVLFILDRRLTKSSTSSGVSRIINRTMTATKGGDAEATLLTTAQFQKTCERIGHAKLDAFFNQWVYGAGCPSFRISQRFNKKKLVVEMTIEQTQVPPTADSPPYPPQDLNPDFFLRDVNEDINEVYADKMARFVGPMTIRIHEADGTPYEHIIDIDGTTTQKLEIPYNTKYKRLKRNRRGQKDQSKGGNTQEPTGDDGNEALLYSLGDVLQSEQDIKEWQLAEWADHQEHQMSEDSYEWIRMDADFEWICKIEINLQPWMFVSQLQQDRDVVAQYESIRYMGVQATSHPHPLISTFLTRTIMDSRYFHGIRTYAISQLPKNAKESAGWIGLTHLRKIFSELCCMSGTLQARANDFSDRAQYVVQLAMPRAFAQINDSTGQVPRAVKRLFVDTLKFNDNSQNEFSDCYWVSTLMSCLTDVLVQSSQTALSYDEQDEEDAFRKDAIGEIERYRRIDEWISSFQNIYSRTALDCLLRLSKAGILQPKLADFLQYTKQGNADQLRLQAFRCLVDLGKLKSEPIVKYMLHCAANDASPYMRRRILSIFGRGLGLVAIGADQPAKPVQKPSDGLIIEEGTTDDRAQDRARKTTIEGAIKALKGELTANEMLANSLWNAVTSPNLTLHEIWQLLCIPEILYDTKDSLIVKLNYPRYWRLRYDGDGKCTFIPTRIRTTPMKVFSTAPTTAAAKANRPPQERKLSMKISLKSINSLSGDTGALTGGTPAVAQTPFVQATMPPPQRPTPAQEKPPPKVEPSPTVERKPSTSLPRLSRIIKLRVPQLRDPDYRKTLASITPKPASPSGAAPKKIRLSMTNGIKNEPSSPKWSAAFDASPPPLQQSPNGNPSNQRRPSTASSGSSKRGQKRKSSELETPSTSFGQSDYFTDVNGNLTGQPQAKKSKKAAGRRSSQASSGTPAPLSTYAPVAGASNAQQFGAWDTPAAESANGDRSMQFGAWDSSAKPSVGDTGASRTAGISQVSTTSVRRPSKVVTLKIPGARLAELAQPADQAPPSQVDSMIAEPSLSLPDPPSSVPEATRPPPLQFGPVENNADLSQPTTVASPGADVTAIGAGLVEPSLPQDSPLSAAPTLPASATTNGGGVFSSDDDEDDMPMSQRNRGNVVKAVDGNLEAPKEIITSAKLSEELIGIAGSAPEDLGEMHSTEHNGGNE